MLSSDRVETGDGDVVVLGASGFVARENACLSVDGPGESFPDCKEGSGRQIWGGGERGG